MRVIILTSAQIPNGMAATNRVKCLARAIYDGGIDCEVLVYQRTERYGSSPKNIEGQGFFKGVPFHYIGGTPLRSSNYFMRFIYDRLDIYCTENYLRRTLSKEDVLFFYMGNDYKLMLRFIKIAKSRGAFCVRDLCELPYGTSKETDKNIRLRSETLKKLFPQLDGVVSISESLLDLAKSNTLASCKHIKVPILVDYTHYYIKEKHFSSDIPYIFHSGTLDQQKDGIIGMFEAFGIACQNLNYPINYVLTGELNQSRYSDELKQIIGKYNLENRIVFVGYLNQEQIKEYLCGASLVISNRIKSQQNYYGFSTKVGEYLASGTPLLTTDWGEANNWLENGKSAYIVGANDTNSLAKAIVHVFNNPKESKCIGRAGQEVCCKCFDYKVWSSPIVDFLYSLCD